MGGATQCDMRCGTPPLRNTVVSDSIPSSPSSRQSTSPIPMESRPANRQVRRAGKRDGFALHAYLTYRINAPNPSIRISRMTYGENRYASQDATYGG